MFHPTIMGDFDIRSEQRRLRSDPAQWDLTIRIVLTQLVVTLPACAFQRNKSWFGKSGCRAWNRLILPLNCGASKHGHFLVIQSLATTPSLMTRSLYHLVAESPNRTGRGLEPEESGFSCSRPPPHRFADAAGHGQGRATECTIGFPTKGARPSGPLGSSADEASGSATGSFLGSWTRSERGLLKFCCLRNTCAAAKAPSPQPLIYQQTVDAQNMKLETLPRALRDLGLRGLESVIFMLFTVLNSTNELRLSG